MTEKEFIHWLQGYLEGVSYDAQKPNPVIQIILDKIKSITTKKVVFDPDIYHPKTIEVPVYTTSTTTTNNFTYPKDKQIITG